MHRWEVKLKEPAQTVTVEEGDLIATRVEGRNIIVLRIPDERVISITRLEPEAEGAES